VKAGTERVGVAEVERLDEVAKVLGDRATPAVKRIIVGRGGFTAELERLSRARADIQLVDLPGLYGTGGQ
jgi:hypothetical protein